MASPRKSYKKSEISRQQVLDAAVRTLAQRGLAKTSVSDIAEAAGMSKGAVHYHFESKDDLIAQVLAHCGRVMRDQVRRAWDEAGDPRDKMRFALRQMRRARQQGSAELRVLADLMAQAIYDDKLRRLVADLFEIDRSDALHHIEQAALALGLEPRVPLRVLPRLLMAILDGLALHDLFEPLPPGDDAIVQDALESIALSLFEPRR